MKIKICGIQTKESSKLCNDLNIDFIGLNFVPISKRFVGLKTVQLKKCNTIAKLFSNKKVGVFMNSKIDIILKILKYVEIDIIQLHGQETPEFIEELKNKLENLENEKYKNLEIWKAFSIKENFDVKVLTDYSKNTDLFLFDGSIPGSGGEINAQNKLMKVLEETEKLKKRYGIAGGINNKNIKKFKENFSKAYLLDTASGVEKNGKFDKDTLKEFVKKFQDKNNLKAAK